MIFINNIPAAFPFTIYLLLFLQCLNSIYNYISKIFFLWSCSCTFVIWYFFIDWFIEEKNPLHTFSVPELFPLASLFQFRQLCWPCSAYLKLMGIFYNIYIYLATHPALLSPPNCSPHIPSISGCLDLIKQDCSTFLMIFHEKHAIFYCCVCLHYPIYSLAT